MESENGTKWDLFFLSVVHTRLNMKILNAILPGQNGGVKDHQFKMDILSTCRGQRPLVTDNGSLITSGVK
jgi:hypothetical protein